MLKRFRSSDAVANLANGFLGDCEPVVSGKFMGVYVQAATPGPPTAATNEKPPRQKSSCFGEFAHCIISLYLAQSFPLKLLTKRLNYRSTSCFQDGENPRTRR